MNKAAVHCHIGTSGWNYAGWRDVFYPPGLPSARWLAHYQEHFRTVEINTTFYHLPPPKTFDHWRAQVSEPFCFAVKASRYLTHMKKLKEPRKPLRLFLGRARRLGRHLGPILYQLPPHWKPDLTRLKEFCAGLPPDLTHVIEFREPAWLTDATFSVLAEHRVGLCIHDIIEKHPRLITGACAYVRFHGPNKRYGGSYPRGELRRWADWLEATVGAGHPAFAYFNNDAEGHAVRNAKTLQSLVSRADSAGE